MDPELQNELSGVIMNGLFTLLGARVRNDAGQLSMRTFAENFTKPQNLMKNIEEVIFNRVQEGNINGTLMQEIMRTPANMFTKVKDRYAQRQARPRVVDTMPGLPGDPQVIDATGMPGAAATAPGRPDVGFTDRMLASIYGLDADNIALMRADGERFNSALEGRLSNASVEGRLNQLMDDVQNQKGVIGKIYEKLYDSDYLEDGRATYAEMRKILQDLGVNVAENGDITFDSKKIVLHANEIPVIKNILKTAKDLDVDVVTPREMHNVRRNIYANRKYQDGMATVPSRTAERMIDALDRRLKSIP